MAGPLTDEMHRVVCKSRVQHSGLPTGKRIKSPGFADSPRWWKILMDAEKVLDDRFPLLLI